MPSLTGRPTRCSEGKAGSDISESAHGLNDEDGAKMVAGRVDTRPAEAIP